MQTTQPDVASRDETIKAILEASKRSGRRAPIRRSFAQQRVPGKRRVKPGPLATFVTRGRESALEQYLLLAAWASAPDAEGRYGVRRPSSTWARALGLPNDARGRQQVSRNWTLLRDLKLIESRVSRRATDAWKLLEDGSGKAYKPPTNAYLGLPYAYWDHGWHEKLDLPAKAMLIIFLTLPPAAPLPFERAPEWYGVSKATAERGIRTLRRNDLLESVLQPIKAPLAPEGYSKRNLYTLAGDFRSSWSTPS